MSGTPAIHPLSVERHTGLGWQRFTHYSFARPTILASLAAIEVVKAALSLPLGFIRQGENWQLVAILGLPPGQNLFVGPDGRWLGAYIPASLRSYPFRMVQTAGDATLAIDEGSGLLASSGGEAFFGADGEPSEAVRSIWSFLQEVAKGEAQLTNACGVLARAELLEPWPIAVRNGESLRNLEGLYRIAEAKLDTLDDTAFLSLRRTGILPLAYAQMFSTGHLEGLLERAEAEGRALAVQAEHSRREAPASDMHGFTFGQSIDVDWSKFGS